VAARREAGEHLCVLFLGSTIEILIARPQMIFCARSAKLCKPGDTLLLGTDFEKDVEDAATGVRRFLSVSPPRSI